MSTGALWVLVLFETGLLLLLLRSLGELRQQGQLSGDGHSRVSHMSGLRIGDQAPGFAATDENGNLIRLEDFSGRRRILTFISPGCSACASTIEALNAITSEEGDLTVLVVGDPDRELNSAYAAELQMSMPILSPSPDLVGEVYRIQGVPCTFVLDEAGIIRTQGVPEFVFFQNGEAIDRVLGSDPSSLMSGIERILQNVYIQQRLVAESLE